MVRADAAVLSTDTLIYGGLVDSRKHNESLTTLMARENRIRALHAQYPKIPIYGFGTIMRTPYASSGGVEPYYYSKYGNDLYRLSGLQDKMDAGKITPDETAELLSLKLSIPSEYLQDWFKRRTKNNTINRMLIKDTKSGVLPITVKAMTTTAKLPVHFGIPVPCGRCQRTAGKPVRFLPRRRPAGTASHCPVS